MECKTAAGESGKALEFKGGVIPPSARPLTFTGSLAPSSTCASLASKPYPLAP